MIFMVTGKIYLHLLTAATNFFKNCYGKC